MAMCALTPTHLRYQTVWHVLVLFSFLLLYKRASQAESEEILHILDSEDFDVSFLLKKDDE